MEEQVKRLRTERLTFFYSLTLTLAWLFSCTARCHALGNKDDLCSSKLPSYRCPTAFWHLTSYLSDGGPNFVVAGSQYQALIYAFVPPHEK